MSDAFAETLFRYRDVFKAVDIAEVSGLSPNQISSFQRGGNLRSDSIDRILDDPQSLAPGAKTYMLSLVAVNTKGISEKKLIPQPE